jgi:cell division protein FtsI (penicillin-binding protein 3)
MIFQKVARRHSIKMQGERNASLELARGRLVLMSALFVLAFMMMAVRAFDLTVLHVDDPVEAAQVGDGFSEVAAKARRGNIYDRNGVLLATTLRVASLYADPYLVSDPVNAAKKLVEIFPDLSYGSVLQNLQSNKRFVWIKRNIMPHEQSAILEIGEPGLTFQYEDKRVYPHGSLMGHLQGYTDIDTRGLSGIERSFDALLASGNDLTLSMDYRLQHALRREVSGAMQEFSGIGGFGVVMDVNTGEILAGVSLPDFDPNTANDASDDEKFNRLSLGVYELGSVFKIFSTAAFLETHDVPLGTTFDVRHPIRVGRFTINDYHPENRVLTLPEVFMYSSNIGSAMIGQAVGDEKLRDFYDDLGLLSPMDFGIKEVGRPMFPRPWREISTLTASYGHGIATTPLQLASAVASIVNGGNLISPRIVKEDMAQGDNATKGRRIVSAKTAHRMRQLLRLVVTDGTGSKADVKGYLVGGKTGTAEKIGPGGYDTKKRISSFVGVFPMDSPQYAIYIAVDEPKGTKASYGYATGGWVSAPAVGRMISSMAAILGIPARDIPPDQDLGASLKQYVSGKTDG